jgi:DNA-binding LytR/AlgR family response regulator
MIVEDRPEARKLLRYLLSLHPDVKIVGEFEDTDSALLTIKAEEGNIDGVFLDIDIHSEGERAGMDLAYRIDRLALPKKPWLVFTTGFKEFALEAHLVCPYGFLLKPLNNNKVTQVLDRIRKIPPPPPPRIEINHITIIKGERVRCTKYVSPDEILYIKTNNNGNTVKVQLVQGEPLDGVSITLKKWMKDYDFPDLMQIHKSHLVNLKHVNGLKPDAIKSECHNATFRCSTTELAVGGNYKDENDKSRNYLDDLRKALGK